MIVRAAAAGVIDFSQCRPSDPAWFRGLRVKLSAFADREELVYLTEVLKVYCALLSRPIPAETYNDISQAMIAVLENIDRIQHPWRPKAETQALSIGAQLAELYRQKIGDPNDPKFRELLEKEQELQAKHITATLNPGPSQEDILMERIRLRDAAIENKRKRR